MADIRRIKLPNGTTYNVKDNTARTSITNITNGTTKLPYGKALSITNTNELNLLDPNNNVLSTVTLPGGGVKFYTATWTGGSASYPRFTSFVLDNSVPLSVLNPGDIIRVAGTGNISNAYKYAVTGNSNDFFVLMSSVSDGATGGFNISTYYDTYFRFEGTIVNGSNTYYLYTNITDYSNRSIRDINISDASATDTDINNAILAYMGWSKEIGDYNDLVYLPYDDNGSYVRPTNINTIKVFENSKQFIEVFTYTSTPNAITHIQTSQDQNSHQLTPKLITTKPNTSTPYLGGNLGPVYYKVGTNYKSTGYFPAATHVLPISEYNLLHFIVICDKYC